MKTCLKIFIVIASLIVISVFLLLVVFFPKEKVPVPENFPIITGSYLGQKLPGRNPERFAPGIIPEDLHTAVVFSPDGNEIYWREMYETLDEIVFMQRENGVWSPPQVVSFSSRFFDSGDPFITLDGSKFFFTSWRPEKWFQIGDRHERIWVMEKTGRGWSKPQSIGETVNAMDLHWQFSLTNDEALYFASGGDLFRSERNNEGYAAPEILDHTINTASREELPFIAPDESYLIFSSNRLSDSMGDFDLFISFRTLDGGWSGPVNLGQEINSPYQDIYPVVSPDGKFLFFLSNRGGSHSAYWVEFETLKNNLVPRE